MRQIVVGVAPFVFEVDRNPEVTRARIHSPVDMGIRTFIDLTTANDALDPYEPYLDEPAGSTGLQIQRIILPIPDMD